MFLDKPTFSAVIASSPLVSIDLLVQNRAGQVLLGERCNRPAQGYWFVPGGRVLKNESLATAFLRVTTAELGVAIPITAATLQGPADHFYADSVFDAQVSTHYVALAYRLCLDEVPAVPDRSGAERLQDSGLDTLAEPATLPELTALPKQQHDRYHWFGLDELRTDPAVHLNTQAYFLRD
jgi:colanic acid biosynthesis protein WcaH